MGHSDVCDSHSDVCDSDPKDYGPGSRTWRLLKRRKMGHSDVCDSHPKDYGPGSRTCRACGNSHGIIRKYSIMLCRQCFRSIAKEIGFLKHG